MPRANASRHAVIVFAKVPRKGRVKTRIAATHGDDCAMAMYRFMLQRTARTLAVFDHHIAYTGAQTPRDLESYFPNATSFFRQRGKTLGIARRTRFCIAPNVDIPDSVLSDAIARADPAATSQPRFPLLTMGTTPPLGRLPMAGII